MVRPKITIEKIVELHRQGITSNTGIAREIDVNLRSYYRFIENHKDEIDAELMKAGLTVKEQPEKQPVTDLQGEVLRYLNKGSLAMEDLSKQLNTSPRVMQAVIEDIKDQGYVVEEVAGTIRLSRTVAPQENVHDEVWDGRNVIRFGVVSDTHLCNKWQQLTHLNTLYDIFEREGIKTVYHAGDVSDGYYKSRPAHIYELFRIGADEQADYIIEKYPKRDGITTKLISGNHDHTHIQNGGTNICVKIANAREDIIYLGMSNAKVNLTQNCVIEINHPEDGSQYALSYSLQKTLDAIMGGTKPNVFLNGHHHKMFYMIYRNIHAFECGTLEAQTPWMRSKKIAAHVGGFIIELHVDDEGTITRCKNEFIPFYRMVENDY